MRFVLVLFVLLIGCNKGNNSGNDADACKPDPCTNGATCLALADGGHSCDCAPGFEGDSCEVDIDDCADDPCANGGACVDQVDGFECDCAKGYEGGTCDVDINDCASNPCLNGGLCTDGVADYTCACASGFTGDDCEVNIDDCPTTDPCVNGTCADGINDWTCSCDAGWEGATCTTDINECDPDPCPANSSCVDLVAAYECPCDVYYAGTGCLCASVSIIADHNETYAHVADFVYGFKFTANEDLIVSRLGTVNVVGTLEYNDQGSTRSIAGLEGNVPVALYDDNGIIAQVTVSPGSPLQDGFRWENITPITLTQGQTYGVMADIVNGGIRATGTPVVDSRITVTETLEKRYAGLPATMTSEYGWTFTTFAANLDLEDCN